jgi:predicted NUDIX family NTP pyrophosphohydrolase
MMVFRRQKPAPEILLVHPGGPFWSRKDPGAWQIPKGMMTAGEEPLAAALREVAEELGWAPEGVPVPLGEIRQKGGKRVIAFAVEGDFDPSRLVSNLFEMEWPPGSGRMQSFPEVDRAAWFDMDAARVAILPSQLPLIDRMADILASQIFDP